MKQKRDFHAVLYDGMRIVYIKGKPYMYTPERIDQETIPEGMYVYSLRHSCDGLISEVTENFVLSNYYGMVVGQDKIGMRGGSYVPRVHEYSWTDEQVINLVEWRRKYNSGQEGKDDDSAFADVALIRKDKGGIITAKETQALLDKLCRAHAYPIEVLGHKKTGCAIGFITLEADKKIGKGYKKADLQRFVANLLDESQTGETGTVIQNFEDLVVWMQV